MAATPGSTATGPWVPVLELAADMASGTGKNPANASDAVSAITNGVYNSTWTTLNPKPYFINATATFKYDPHGGIVYSKWNSAGTNMSSIFGSQFFNLTPAFCQGVNPTTGTTLTCQCNDIANFQSILLASLGVSETPLAISGSGYYSSPTTGRTRRTRLPTGDASYYPAGSPTADSQWLFPLPSVWRVQRHGV